MPRLLFVTIALLGLLTTHAPHALAQRQAPAAGIDATARWIEPRGLSAVDLVGLVPDEHLRDAILTFTGGAGILQYMEGSRNGNTVIVKVKVSPRYPQPGLGPLGTTTMNCLGKRALHDEWPITVPPSTMRVYSGGQDITGQVFALWHYPSGQLLPTRNAFDRDGRYKDYELKGPPSFAPDDSLIVPGNSGCTIFLWGEYSNLTAEFRFEVENKIKVDSLGSQTFRFGSYVGIGEAGVLAPLQQQLIARFGERHDKFFLYPPEGADYVFVKFPPTPVSPYSGAYRENIVLPSSGTYRLADGDKDLSVDHTASAAMPYLGQWLDADITEHYGIEVGVEYLMPLPRIDTLSSPEYFVPAGIEFDPCMLEGTCPNTFLNDIFYADKMEMTVYYYAVERTGVGLDRIPLRQVGREWQSSGDAATAAEDDMPAGDVTGLLAPSTTTLPPLLYFPVLMHSPPPPPDDRTGCPCGWFTADGRMLDYVPRP